MSFLPAFIAFAILIVFVLLCWKIFRLIIATDGRVKRLPGIGLLCLALFVLLVTEGALSSNNPGVTQQQTTAVPQRPDIVPAPIQPPAKGSKADMVLIPAGSFMMGSPRKEEKPRDDENPQHKVYLDSFYMDKYDVTTGAYAACVMVGKCTPPFTDEGKDKYETNKENELSAKHGLSTTESLAAGVPANLREDCNWGKADRGNYPVNCVNWYQAKAYCEWRGKRLPTEAEWEKAARGGTTTYWSFGDITALAETERYEWCTQGIRLPKEHTHPVGQKLPNPYELYDMYGNVSQWVSDSYDERYYSESPEKNPKGPATVDNPSQNRVSRGTPTTWNCSDSDVAERLYFEGDTAGDVNGFRCASN
jgi:formylglycine-generating enzyme required for sulfatase activity